jgi:hypothetical protein
MSIIFVTGCMFTLALCLREYFEACRLHWQTIEDAEERNIRTVSDEEIRKRSMVFSMESEDENDTTTTNEKNSRDYLTSECEISREPTPILSPKPVRAHTPIDFQMI